MPKITIKYFEFEIPILEALSELGGEAEINQIYDWIRKNKTAIFDEYPEILDRYKTGKGDIIWQNKIRWAREYMKRKGQLKFPERGVWKLTQAGIERLRLWQQTRKDPDAGLEIVLQLPEEKDEEPERAFEILEYSHGDILGIKNVPIVYEPINEQGVILLFTTLAARLGFLIISIRPQFPDAKLAKRDETGRYKDLKAEFEYKSSTYLQHGHSLKKSDCDYVICWEDDWKNPPSHLKIIELKSELEKITKGSAPKLSSLIFF